MTTTKTRGKRLPQGMVFEDAPKAKRVRKGASMWDAKLAPLEKKAGKWARVRVYSSNASAASTATILKTKYGSKFDFAARKMDDEGLTGLYAKCNPN